VLVVFGWDSVHETEGFFAGKIQDYELNISWQNVTGRHKRSTLRMNSRLLFLMHKQKKTDFGSDLCFYDSQ